MARLRRRIRRDTRSSIFCEKRLLVGVTASSMVAVLLWVVAVATDFWFIVDSPGGVYINRTGVIFLSSHSGLWRICKTYIINVTKPASKKTIYNCEYHTLFPTDLEIQQDPELDGTILNYTRTETSFSIISLLLMAMAIGFSLYTFQEPRYMFKRLAGGVHYLTAASVLVVIEVLVNSVKYEEQFLSARHPKGANWSYGFSFGLAWLTFLVILVTGTMFILFSRKRKGSKAATEFEAREDEPNILGRL